MPTAPAIDSSVELQQEMIERILASRYFAKAQLLAEFLRYAWQRSSKSDGSHLNEQEIGVQVFRRRPGYDPGEDNIVRNYARQLRKRLEDYYAHEGSRDAMRVEMPRGGYVLVFSAPPQPDLLEPVQTARLQSILGGENGQTATDKMAEPSAKRQSSYLRRILVVTCLLLLLSGVGYWYYSRSRPASDPNTESLHVFWGQLFPTGNNTYIVPADTGFVMLQEMSGKTYTLAEYEAWPGIELYDHKYASYLRAQRYTSMLDLQLVSQLERRPEADPNRTVLRSARDLKIDDLNNGNAILLGSIYSNPWIEVFQSKLNFHFVYSPSENRAWIANLHPLPGEDQKYFSSWSSYSHTTYAVLAYLPNLGMSGHVLLVQGMDGSGTQAAAQMIFNGENLRQILSHVRRPDGSLKSFEVLLRATDIGSHATNPQILSVRLLD
jgi:hypothetical protein